MKTLFYVTSAVLITTFAGSLLTSCTTQHLQPLSTLGPKKIGPVSCQLAPDSATTPTYSSGISSSLGGNLRTGNLGRLGLGHGGLLKYVGDATQSVVEAPGQADLNQISIAAGSAEPQLLLEAFRKKLIAEGYIVRAGAPSTFLVHIPNYGLHKVLGGKALLRIDGSLSLNDSTGKLIWNSSPLSLLPPEVSGDVKTKNTSFLGNNPTLYLINAYHKLPNREFTEYKSNPGLYRSAFVEASNLFATHALTRGGTFH